MRQRKPKKPIHPLSRAESIVKKASAKDRKRTRKSEKLRDEANEQEELMQTLRQQGVQVHPLVSVSVLLKETGPTEPTSKDMLTIQGVYMEELSQLEAVRLQLISHWNLLADATTDSERTRRAHELLWQAAESVESELREALRGLHDGAGFARFLAKEGSGGGHVWDIDRGILALDDENALTDEIFQKWTAFRIARMTYYRAMVRQYRHLDGGEASQSVEVQVGRG